MSWAATHTFSVGEVLTAANMNLIQNNINAGNPVGALKFVIGATGGNATETVWQAGWLEANAAQVSRSTYSALFSYLNGLSPALAFGTGNGSTTFHLPDLQGRYPVHVTTAGHADVGTLGNSEGVTFDKRRPKHRTTDNKTVSIGSLGISDPTHVHATVNNAGQSGPLTDGWAHGGSAISWTTSSALTGVTLTGGPTLGGSIGTNVGNDSIDTSPYLVAGIWVVKF